MFVEVVLVEGVVPALGLLLTLLVAVLDGEDISLWK